MELEMVLNELSLKTPASDVYTARQLMSDLIGTLRQAKVSGVKRILRTSDEIHSLELAPNYHIYQWRNDPEVDKEESRFFKTLVTKAPFWTDVLKEIENQFQWSEVRYQGEVVQGIGFALVIDGLPVSFNSETRWNYSFLNLEVLRIEDDREINETVEIPHVSCPNHLKQHNDWIQDRIRKTVNINSGQEIWEQREELFPNIDFCNSVNRQLQNIRYGQIELKVVIKALLELQNCCKNWNEGYFSVQGYALEESGESEPTLNKYRQERIFVCPDGKERLFERHIKLRLCNWRIHFIAEKPGKLIIGYIGRHLPTVNYRT